MTRATLHVALVLLACTSQLLHSVALNCEPTNCGTFVSPSQGGEGNCSPHYHGDVLYNDGDDPTGFHGSLGGCRTGNYGCSCEYNCRGYGDCCKNFGTVCEFPVIDAMTPTSGDTSGNDEITITGQGFLTVEGTVSVGAGSCDITSWTDSQILCNTPAGSGATNAVKVLNVNGKTSNGKNFAYDRPDIDSIEPTTAATVGGAPITLTGTSFSADEAQVIFDGVTLAASAIVSRTHDEVIFSVPAGEGRSKSVELLVNGQRSNLKQFSYNPPSISSPPSPSPANGPTAGVVSIELVGSSFGTSPSVTVGGATCLSLSEVTHGRLLCSLPPGQGVGRQVRVSTAGQLSNVVSFNYDRPDVTSITPATGPTGVETVITLEGLNFGQSGTITVGTSNCPIVSGSYTDTEVRCRVPPGEGEDLPVVLRVAGQTADIVTFSYDAPSIGSVSPLTGPTQGGNTLEILGDNFGFSPSVTVGGAPCLIPDESSSSHNFINCTVPEGQGNGHDIVVSLLERSVTAADSYSYTSPDIDSISPTSGPTSGSLTLTLHGTNFGTSGTVTVDSKACNPTGSGFTHTQVTCFLPVGAGQNREVFIDVSGNTDTFSPFNYNPPSIHAVSPLSGPTSGGVLFTVQGASFGKTGSVRVHGEPCPTQVFGHSNIICQLPPGSGSGLVEVTAQDGRTATWPFTYGLPAISTIFPNSGSTAGGTNITISGSSFESAATPGSVLVHESACSVVSWSHTSILCTTPSGVGDQRLVTVETSSGESTSDLSATFSYLPPSVSGISPAEGATENQVLQISGQNFGADPSTATVYVGASECAPVAGQWSHTQIRCTVAPGEGRNYAVQVVVEGQSSSQSVLFSFTAPQLTTVAPTVGATAGGEPLVLSGFNFGLNPTVFVGGNPCPLNTSETQTHSRLVCSTPAGQGQFKTVQVVAGSQLSNGRTFSYDGPSISDVDPRNGPTSGGTRITITGASLGTSGLVTVGGVNCDVVPGFHTDQEIQCITRAGEGKSRWVQAFIAAVPSNILQVFNFDSPTVDSVTPDSGPTTGSTSVVIRGTNFGLSGTARIGGSLCDLQSRSHTQIVCRTPEGSGRNQSVQVSVLGTPSTTRQFHYNPPNITDISPRKVDSSGAVALQILGTNFGRVGSVTVGGRVCSPTGTGFAQTTITCFLPAGQGSSVVTSVTVGDQTAESTLFGYNRPRITELLPSNGPTGGDKKITVKGASFGLSGSVLFGEEPCPVVPGGYTHGQIVCTLPVGSGSQDVVVTSGDQSSDSVPASLFSYDRPSVFSIVPRSGPTQGQITVTVSGSSFDASGTVSIGGRQCNVLTWSHSETTCTLPAGFGRNNVVRITSTVSGLASTETWVLFDYAKPQIVSISPTTVGTSGTETLVLTGTGFGTSPTASDKVLVGSSECTKSPTPADWNHTEIRCLLPKIEGAGVRVSVTYGSQRSNDVALGVFPPKITKLVPTSGDSSGGITLTLTGSNFGTSPQVTVATAACPIIGTPNATTVFCSLPPGQGTNQPVTIRALGQLSNELLFTYNGPTINGTYPSAGPTAGNITLAITGTSLGTSGLVTVGGSNCPTSLHTSTRVECTLPAGEGVGREIRIIVASKTSNAWPFSYQAPTITDVDPLSADSSGGSVVTVRGTNFGTSGFATIGGRTCTPTSQVLDHSEIRCRVPEGDGAVNDVAVHVATQSSDPYGLPFSYDVPDVQSVTPAVGPTVGGTVLTVRGSSFGTSGQVTVGSQLCPIVPSSYDHDVVRCYLPEGQGGNLPVVVESNEQVSSGDTKFSYSVPRLTSLSPTNGPTLGGVVITLTGSHFGTTGSVTINNAPCALAQAGYDHSHIECSLPAGSGFNLDVVVRSAGQNSSALTFRYDTPKIDSYTTQGDSKSTAGGYVLTLFGSNLNGVPAAVTVSVDGRDCPVTYANHDEVRCTMPIGSGKGNQIVATVGSQGSNVLTFDYAAPVVSSVTADEASGCTNSSGAVTDCSIASGGQLVVTGSNFFDGSGGTLTTVTVGSLSCDNVVHDSVSPHTMLTCDIPANAAGGFNLPVKVQVDAQSGSAALFSYAGPEILPNTLHLVSDPGTVGSVVVDTSSAATDPHRSTVTVSFRTRNFGSDASAITVSYGSATDKPYECSGVSLGVASGNERDLVCQLEHGAGSGLVFSAQVGAQASIDSVDTLTYSPTPQITSGTLRLANGGVGTTDLTGTSTEGELIRFDGLHFGALGAPQLRVMYGVQGSGLFDLECTNAVVTAGADESGTIECLTSPGEGSDYVFQVSVLGSTSVLASTPDTYSYPVAPIVFSVTGCSVSATNANATVDCPTEGGTEISITGDNFAASNASTSVRVGVSPCVILRFEADSTRIVCRLAQGVGFSKNVRVIVGKLFSRPKALLSYSSPLVTSVSGCTASASTPSTTIDCPRAPGTPTRITLLGQYFGASDAQVLVGGQNCGNVVHSSTTPHRELSCDLPSGKGINRVVMVIQDRGEAAATAGLGRVSYVRCVAGQYDVPGSLQCAACPRGSFTATSGQQQCRQCESGYFAASPQSTVCELCARGRFSQRSTNATTGAIVGPSACTECSPGEFASGLGESACSECVIGEYTANNGSEACTSCAEGKFAADTGADTCEPCEAGEFAAGVGAFGCDSCLPGTYSAAAQASACETCEVGKFQDRSGRSECTSCPIGSAMPSSGQIECDQCDSGFFSNDTGLDQCLTCPAGSISVKTGAIGPTECTPCPAGRFISVGGQSICLLCFRGTAQASEGSSSCDTCETGRFASTPGSSECTDCAEGTFASTEGQETCEPCATGKFAVGERNTLCTLCAAGTYQDATSQSSCTNCTAGSAVSTEGRSSPCDQCPSGQFAPTSGMVSCKRCPAGSKSVNTGADLQGPTECALCDAGRFASATGQASCTACPAGQFASVAGSTACSACAPGNFSATSGSILCEPCPEGQFATNDGSITCEDCPVGTRANTTGSVQCSQCPVGTAQGSSGESTCETCRAGTFAESEASSLCLECPPGSVSAEGSSQCTECEAGQYQPLAGQDACLECPEGTFTDASGAVACTECSQGEIAATSGLSECTPCDAGTFAAAVRSSVCTNCFSGSYTSSPGAFECEAAPVGRYVPEESATASIACSKGYFQDATGQSSCKPCANGTFINVAGQAACVQCASGFYADRPGRSTCAACRPGTFATNAGQANCEPCEVGHFAQGFGAIECDSCNPGQFADEVGSEECTPCPAGKFADQLASDACTDCAEGTAATSQGATSCPPCSDGFFANVTGMQSCLPCAEGYFSRAISSGQGAEECTACDPGRFQSATGQSQCIRCPRGFEAPEAAAAACTPCEAGYVAEVEGTEECEPCARGRFAQSSGQALCAACPVGRASNTSAATECPKCGTGFAQDEVGKIECEACEAGTFANVEGLVQCETCPIGTQSPAQADSCTSCPAGSYQSASGSETCLPCPLGRAVSSSGAALCPQCALGKFSGRLGGEQCVSCEPGQFANSPGSTVCGNCTGGSFSSVPGSFECSECPAGKYSVRPDSRVGPLLSSCTDCPRGMYQSFTGETRCLLCPAGSATKVEGSRACKACPLGTFATEDGSEECTECPTGKASNVGSATSCLNCTAGFFANLAGSITCEPCAPGSVSGEGVTECTPCKVGYFQSAQGQLTCEPCEAGTANALSGQSACFTCAAGKFSNTTAATRCEVCAAGTFNQAAVGATSCEPCSAGTFLGASGQDRCEQCPLGYISTSEGSLSCEPCREGTIADQPGSTECEVCSAGRFAASQAAFVCRACAAGRFAATNSSSGCSACPTGKYVGDAGRTQCFECPLGRHAKGEGTISCAVCQPGRFMNSTGATVCSACPKGRHQPAAGQTNCVDCEAGRFSDSSGLPDCLLCPTGRYETQNRSDECTDCNPGSFQQQAGQVGCDLCPAGRFQIAQGEFLCVGCPTGRFNDDVGQLTCRQCPPGRFTDQVNSTRCWDCPEGRFASGNGTATCDLCPPGSFGNTTAQTECDQCAVGRHQDEAGQIECVDCVAGKFSSVPGSIDCRSCPLGRYEPDPQSTECTRCETGRFSPVTGAEDCVDCRLGEFSGGLGQAQCDICPAGRYGDELALDECKECQVGRHANRTGAQSCDPCTPGRFASVRGLVTCDGCKAGRFTSTTLQTQCTACGSGKSQPLAAQSGCVACGAGKFKASEGAKSCDLCAAGWISPLSNADRTKCLACPVGTYMPFQGHTGSVCTACPSGRHAQFVGRPQCSACARGKFSVLAQGASVGAVVCTDCDKGKFAGTVASSRCGECAVGRFASAVGREACQVCEPGSVGNSTGLTNCTLCPAGKYQGLAGQAECIVCERGTFSASPGAVACDPCPPGSVVNVTGATECTLCDVGSHAEEEGMFECDDCVAGRFAQDRGLAQCTLCAEGTFSTQIGRDRSCVPCPPGSFSNGTGGTGCELCSPGYVSPVPEQALCTPCAVGSYQPDGNRTVCLACGPGRFVSKEAATECEDCGVGQFQGGSGQGECVDCPAGSFADEPRRSSCTRCPIGKHAAAEGASECTSCIVGRYANATGLVNCELCERGTYGPSEGLTECVTCESGSEAPNLGQRICQPCSPGRFAENNTAECVTCPPLSVAPSAGAAYCQACDKLSVANALRTRCLCEVGYYADDEAVAERNALLPRSDRTQLGLCKECPFGARCDEVGVQFSTMETRAGFWRADTRSTEFYACPRETQCLGGRNSSCKPNHLPPLCGVCAEGYYSTARGNCALCPPKAAAVVSFLIMTAVVVVLLMLQFWILLRSGQELMSQAKRIDDRKRDGLDEFDEYEGDSNRDLHQGPSAAKMLRTPEGGLEVDDDAEDDPWNQDSDDETKLAAQLEQHSKQVKLKSSLHQPPPPEPSLIYKMKIAIGFVQIMTNLSFSADVPWPSGYKEFIAWFNVLNFDFIKISSVECVFETNYYRKFLIVSVSPIILFFTVALVYFVPKYFQVCFRDDSAESRKRSRRRFWRMFIFTLFLIYPTVSSTVLRLYVCKNIEGENYLVSDLRVKCDTEKHDDYERAGVLMILIYPFGIPLFLLYMLFKYRHKLDDFGVRAQLGFLYDGYFHEFWWFELVDMFHKLFLVALLAFIDVDLQLEVGMAVVISYLVLLLLLNPYIRDGDDRLHQLAQVEIFLLLLSVHVFEHELDDDAVLDGILSAVLIGLALTFFAFFVPQAFWVVVKMCVRKWACLGRRLRNVKKVQKWLRSDVDRERAATMLSAEDIREIQEGRSVIAVGGTGGRRNSDEHDGVKLQRNPAYDATAGGTLIVNRDENMLRGVELVANPMMRQYRVEYREERDQLVTTLDQVAPLNLRSSAADRLERPQLGQAQLGEDEMPATVLEQQKKRSQKRREARKDFAMVRPHQKPTEPGT